VNILYNVEDKKKYMSCTQDIGDSCLGVLLVVFVAKIYKIFAHMKFLEFFLFSNNEINFNEKK